MSFFVDIITLFPEAFPGPLHIGKLYNAYKKGSWQFKTWNIRDFAEKKSDIDAQVYGGGSGMLIKAEIIHKILKAIPQEKNSLIGYVSPRGEKLQQTMLESISSQYDHLILLCGRYEGIDQRVIDYWNIKEICIGDFVCNGGEIPAMLLIEAWIRLLPGVVGNAQSLQEESFQNNLLEYPQYTRPQKWQNIEVPSVLLSGHHEKIRKWRNKQRENTTQNKRPDLWKLYKNR